MVRHPDLAVIQDIATQAGQGRLVKREGERLGRSDIALILWRKVLARELRAIAEGSPRKRWSVAGYLGCQAPAVREEPECE